MKSRLYKYNGFKLISLEIKDNTLLSKSKSLYYEFLDESDELKIIYTTVLIGVNGTGKSNLFRIIIELFKELFDLKEGGKRTYNVDGRFKLLYSLNGDIYEYSNFIGNDQNQISFILNKSQNSAFLLKNGKQVEFNKAQFPISIVANSMMLTDKYPIYGEDVFQTYKYLGIRNRPQTASTRSYVRKTIEYIVKELDTKAFRNGLHKATNFLGLSNSIEIFYYTNLTTTFFNGELKPYELEIYFKGIKKKYPNPEDNPPYKLFHYLKIKKEKSLINEICEFCNGLYNDNRLINLEYLGAQKKRISYDIMNDESYSLLKNDYSFIEHLRQLGIISPPEIILKRNHGYSLQESSSGEYHFFSSIVGLMATIKPNSLLFIDEPEASLHPNWQMQYLSFVRELFSSKEYATSHLFIATHSHFLISDLQGKDSKIIALKREDGEIKIAELPEQIDTFGWSPDDILYNIFDVASSRNKFVAEDIADILNTLSKGGKDGINKIDRKIYDTLIHLRSTLKDNDPLKEVVKSILNKITQ